MGIALGECGLSLDDFWRLTAAEFGAVVSARRECAAAQSRTEWERTRILAAMVMQPHCKNRLDPHRILPLPWDKEPQSRSEARKDCPFQSAPALSKDEARSRFLQRIQS